MKMKVLLFAICLTVLAGGQAQAQTSVMTVMGSLYATTVKFNTTDTSQLLTTAIDAALGSSGDYGKVKAVLITAETNAARIAFGVTATTSLGHVLAAGSSLRIPSSSLTQAARIISSVAGSHATLQVTLEY